MTGVLRAVTALLLSCAVLFLLPGCWDYHSINRRAAVIGIGIDPSQTEQKLNFTFQIPILSVGAGEAQSKSSSGASSTASFKNISVDAYSIDEAVRSTQLKIERQLDTAEIRAVVINKGLSAPMMDSILSQLIRLPRINRLAHVFVSTDSAKDVLSVRRIGSAPAEYLDKVFQVRQSGYSVQRQLWQFWSDTTQVGVVPVLPVARVVTLDSDEGDVIELGGAQVYENNQPAFVLNKDKTFYLNLLWGKTRGMALDVPTREGILSLTDFRARSRLQCKRQGKQIYLVAQVRATGTLGKVVVPKTSPEQPVDVSKVESEVSAYLKKQLTSTLQGLQKQQADVVGFGKIYLQHYPNQELLVKKDWGKMFEQARTQVNVNVSITNKGMLI